MFRNMKTYQTSILSIIFLTLEATAGEEIVVPDAVASISKSPWNFFEDFESQNQGQMVLCRFFSKKDCLENLSINDKGTGFTPFQIKKDLNGNKYLEITVGHGWNSDPHKKKGEETERAEIQTIEKNTLNKIVWTGFKMRIPDNFQHIDERVLFFQFKNQFDSMKRSPLLGLRFYKNGDILDIGGDTGGIARKSWNKEEWIKHGIGVQYERFEDQWILRKQKLRGFSEFRFYGDASTSQFNVSTRGEWVTYKIGIHNSNKEDGFVKVYQNDNLIFDYKGVTYDWDGKYLGSHVRLGLYRDSGARVGIKHPNQSIEFDNFTVVSDKQTLDQFVDR